MRLTEIETAAALEFLALVVDESIFPPEKVSSGLRASADEVSALWLDLRALNTLRPSQVGLLIAAAGLVLEFRRNRPLDWRRHFTIGDEEVLSLLRRLFAE